ncbi:MAG: LacI family transcriptional regulator [Ardenticatenaceae bacterium]|nr:LacI family transcriptional regulator [Ardenticatenaceae bacterium]
MAAQRRVTIKQVAREAGVSAQTVSRVINDRRDVSAETRQRVKAVIDRLGYQPSYIARSLISGSSCTIGVVVWGLQFYGPFQAFLGIEQAANEQGYDLFLRLTQAITQDDGKALIKSMLSHQVDGIIWAVPESGQNHDWICTAAHTLPVPIVFLSMRPRPSLHVAAVDNRVGGRIATEHLVAQGYRKVGLIAGPLSWWEAAERRRGWVEALEATGLPADETAVVEGDWTPRSGEQAMYRLLERHASIEAVFVSNDQMALGAMKAARAAGRTIPDDLALIGFDDISEAPYLVPPLSTIRQDLDALGRQAVHKLISLFNSDDQDNHADEQVSPMLQPELIIRESSGAIR